MVLLSNNCRTNYATRGNEECICYRRSFSQKHLPTIDFLWPITMVNDPRNRTFGYLMPLLPREYQGLERLVLGKMRPVPNFYTLCTAAIQLAQSFKNLHAKGLCYKDINSGGPFINPKNWGCNHL